MIPHANQARRTATWATVAKREIMAQISERAFWIATLSTLVLTAIAFAIVTWLASSSGPTKVAVATDQAQAVVKLAAESGLNVEAVRVSADKLESVVLSGDAEAALSRADGQWSVSVSEPRSRPDLDDAVREYQLGVNATALGVDVAEVTAGTSLNTRVLGETDNGGAIMIASIGFSILFVMAATSYGYQIAQSVTTEKESRIVEILAAAIPVRQLLIGKVVGNTALALGQVVLLVVVTLGALSATEYGPLVGTIVPVAGWFMVFFLIGFVSLACLWAAAGAMATRVQDLSQTTTPLMMLVMAVYFAGLMAQGTVAKVLSYVPIASTVLMPGRLLSGQASWVDAVLALLVALVFMAAAVWFGASVYRRGLLQTNAVMGFKQALIGR